ncbi:metalloendoproteinase 1-like [Primulina huaijiensis]|uniref:metalloendoproteinase 1-like n=1 Tax=Primulina huaijiensis TaxID=1492673 RepID=UPI003CC71189
MTSKIAFLYILVLSAILIICHAHHNFLKDLNGTRKGDHANGLIELKKFLSYLGYVNPDNSIHMNDDFFDDELESGVKEYQTFFKLKVTGVLDQETLNLMSKPRCGTPDHYFIRNSEVNHSFEKVHLSISSRYRLVRAWPPDKRNLTFSYSPDTRPDAKVPIVTALLKWSQISPFRFLITYGYVGGDIKIGFKSWDHGDGYPFDGRGGILAHAFYPQDGRVHFDADEIWDTEVRQGTLDIQAVALHEVGHTLGLGHSADPTAVMFPHVEYGEPRKHFSQDDIDGIRALYPNN